MTFVAKKNSVYAVLTADITSSDTSIPISLCEYFSDSSGTLITAGIVIGFDATDRTTPEEITITARSATSGAGNLTGATRGVNADGTIGAAKAWPSGTKIAVMFTTGSFNAIVTELDAIATELAAKAIGPGSSTAGHLAVFSGTDGLTLSDGGAVPSGGSIWTSILSSITTTPASTSTITTTSDLTGSVVVGDFLKYTISSTTYYARITAITSSLITIAGAPLSSTITAIYYCDKSRGIELVLPIVGYFDDGNNNSTLIASDLMGGTSLKWAGGDARIVQIKYALGSIDSGATQPTVNILNRGNAVISSAVTPTATEASTVVNLSTSYLTLTDGNVIEVEVVSDGTNKDAWTLLITIIAVPT